MVLAETIKSKQLLHISYIGHVTLADAQTVAGEIRQILTDELSPGFRLLTDLSRLDRMDVECEEIIGRVMEFLQEKGVTEIVRVIPDPSKDIGLNIMSLFRYSRSIRPVTCKTVEEAGRILSL